MIISVGFNPKRGIRFRQWANNVLQRCILNGYAVSEQQRRDQLAVLRKKT